MCAHAQGFDGAEALTFRRKSGTPRLALRDGRLRRRWSDGFFKRKLRFQNSSHSIAVDNHGRAMDLLSQDFMCDISAFCGSFTDDIRCVNARPIAEGFLPPGFPDLKPKSDRRQAVFIRHY